MLNAVLMQINAIGARIRALRTLRGLSTEEFARRVGRTRQAVEHWEAGRRTPPLKTLEAIANVLRVDLEMRLVPSAAELDDHAAAVLLRLADVLPAVPPERRRVLVAQIEELEERYAGPKESAPR
jgi:transcriptional regulator with XRE-family HTH domain